MQVGVTGKETALSRGQRRSHSVSAPRFSAIKLDQTGIQWRQRLNFTVPSCTCTTGKHPPNPNGASFSHFLFLKLTAACAEWRLLICLDDTDLKFIEVCASQGQGAMTRLAGKIAQAVQTRNEYAMSSRRLVSDKQVKKIDSIITWMAKVRDCLGDLCVDKGARFNDNVFSQFLSTRCSVFVSETYSFDF